MERAVVRFAEFEVDRASGELRKDGLRVKLQEQPLQVLLALLERPGEIVTREDLYKRLWPDTVVDFDRGLNKAVNRLRESLSDDADTPRFVETLPQRGYRFLVPVESVEPPAPRLRDRRTVLALGGSLIALPVIGLAYRALRSSPARVESIAILPLENLSRDPAQEYFSDGMTDQLIGEIARIGSLRVTSRTSVMRYKGTRKSLPDIAAELAVDAILEGTVTQADGKVRITAQLIRSRDDRHLWSEKYERDLTDVLALQSDVARAVARQVEIALTPSQQAGLARRRSVAPEAYDALLRGNYFLYRGIPSIPRSVEYFGTAIRIDPQYAEAHAGLAEALVYLGIFGVRPSAGALLEARAAATKALEIDATSARAHNVLADVKKGYDWDLAGAVAEYGISLALNPSLLLTRFWYGECLARMQRHDEALAQSEQAIALDPVSPNSHGNRAMLLFRARRYRESIGTAHQAIELDPNFANSYWWQGLSYAGLGDFSKALASLSKGAALSEGPLFKALLGYVYGMAGDKPKALAIVAELRAIALRRYVSPMDFAIVYGGLRDADSAFGWLEKAYETRSARVHELPFLHFDAFRSDPRYPDLMKRVGLPV